MTRAGQLARPRHSARFLLTHASLLWRVARQDLATRYAGSLLGAAWAVISPLVLLSIYAIVYLAVLRVRVPTLTSSQYVLYIFAGLVPYLATAEALSVGIGSVVASRSVLANTVFPVDLVPAKAVLLSQVTLVAGLSVVLAGSLFAGLLGWPALLLPVIVLLHFLAMVGAVWILSLLNVIARDLQNVLNSVLIVLLIASPISYTPEMVPRLLRPMLFLNPVAWVITAYQRTLVLSAWPSPAQFATLAAGSLLLFYLGGWFFSRAKRVLVDYV